MLIFGTSSFATYHLREAAYPHSLNRAYVVYKYEVSRLKQTEARVKLTIKHIVQCGLFITRPLSEIESMTFRVI